MVYCPKCGKKFTDNSKTCDSCGEILSEEINLQRIIKIFDAVGIIAGILMAIIIFFFRSYLNSLTFFLIFCIITLLAAFFLSTSVRRRIQWFIIKITFGGMGSKQCPECENVVADDNYCLNCGYDLQNVKGYWLEREQYVEINKNYLRVFKTYREYRDITLYRYRPVTYDLDKIEFPEVKWCSHVIFTSPCLTFKYMDKKVEVPINQKILDLLKDMFPTLTAPESISGPITWVSNQHKVRFSVVVITLLALILAAGWFISPIFTPAPSVPLASATSDIQGLEFVYVNGSSSSSNLVVEGYVKNTGNSNINLTFIWLNITGYDSSGNYVASDDTYISISKENASGIRNLPPGGTGYFKEYMDDPKQEITSFKISTYTRKYS